MELDQLLFKKAHKFFKKLREKPTPPEILAKTASLEAMKNRLTVLARALTGEAIVIAPAEREGGWRGMTFLLPVSISACATLEENEQFYVFRVCYLATQRRLNLNWFDEILHTPEESRQKAEEYSSQILSALSNDYPAISERISLFRLAFTADPSYLFGRFFSPPLLGEETSVLSKKNAREGKEKAENSPKTELKAKPKDDVKNLEVNREEIERYTLNHSFEKIETLEEFDGNWRDLDGSDDLNEHSDALEEVNISQTVRVDDTAHSLLQADFLGSGTMRESADAQAEIGETVHTYDEWDFSKRAYKRDYCSVYAGIEREKKPEYIAETFEKHRLTLARLHRQFTFFHNKHNVVRRQSDGDDLDLEVMVENFAELHAGRSPSENIYISSRRKERDIAILMLMDRSLSTDSYTDNQRVGDVIKQSAILFGELLAEYGIRFQIDAFSSQTRNYCSYTSLKTFSETWVASRARIGAVTPRGYTRIGPALRHASALLEKESARLKWLLLLSDGKPNDYDRYEGKYGIQDVRQAVREIEGKNIHLYALAVEATAKNYLPLMLGDSGYRILPHPRQLPNALAELYGTILTSRKI